MSKDNGGPAFPFVSNGGITDHQYCDSGMQLRDYFAAKAMQATQSNPEWNHWSSDQHAECAYGMADAMLEARKK